MKKMPGAEYKAFMASDWDALLGVTNAYMSDAEITVNGREEPDDVNEIADSAKVEIRGGCVMADEYVDMSFETAFVRWRKTQTNTTLVVEVPNNSVDALKASVVALNGRWFK